jgi:large conductance mechanosensitive channel
MSTELRHRSIQQIGGAMSFASEFKEFALKGNVVDLAVGVIIAAAFGKIVDSIVKDLIMPLVGEALGGLDFSSYFIMLSNPPADFKGPMTYDALTKAGVPLFAYGNFITVAINFVGAAEAAGVAGAAAAAAAYQSFTPL